MRLIDANALLAELDKFANPMPNKSGYDFLCGIATVITEIEDAPTVEAVILPCKIGATVYFPGGRTGTVTSFYHCENPNCGNLWVTISQERYTRNKKRVNICASDIGKTVFLTREEAEAALAKMG